jgi:hypothetical protein
MSCCRRIAPRSFRQRRCTSAPDPRPQLSLRVSQYWMQARAKRLLHSENVTICRRSRTKPPGLQPLPPASTSWPATSFSGATRDKCDKSLDTCQHRVCSGYSALPPPSSLFAVPPQCPPPLPLDLHQHLSHVSHIADSQHGAPVLSLPPAAAAAAHAALPPLPPPSSSFQRPPSVDWRLQGCVPHHTPHAPRHTPHATRHTPHVIRHTSHATRHTPQHGDARAQSRVMRLLLG